MIDVPITADCEPNIYFTALAMFDYEAFQDSRRIVVPPKRQFLDVNLKTPKATFKPGEKATVEVEIKDSDGKPVQTELALGAADAAVWAIQGELAENIQKSFWSRMRGLNFNVTSSAMETTQHWKPKKEKPGEFEQEGLEEGFEEKLKRNLNLQFQSRGARRMMGESTAMTMDVPAAPMTIGLKSAPSGAARARMAERQAGAAPMAEARVRTNFASTALWLPTLVTGPDGKARAEVTFPDSLTTWKLTARAADKQTRVGELRTEVKTTKPVLVRPEGPRFFTQGDAVTLSAIVNNNSSQTLPVEVSLDLSGLKLTNFDAQAIAGASKPDQSSTEPVPSNEPKIKIMVPAQGQRRVDWRVLAETPGTAKIKTTALSTPRFRRGRKELPGLRIRHRAVHRGGINDQGFQTWCHRDLFRAS